MLYPFLTLSDGTEIVYSGLRKNGDENYVIVKFERWNDKRDDFDSMECKLPNGDMEKVIGFSTKEAVRYHKKMLHLQDMILECSKEDTELELCQ
ncbi:MAG: hypothetical protein IKN12_01185 [Selenomonadaceae bacterium]|nr:hypothetical protein [Selenomonadaceae bacterium]